MKKLIITILLIALGAFQANAADISELQGITGKIGSEDVSWGTGQATDTFTVPTYSGGTVTLTKIPALAPGTSSTVKGVWYVSNSATITDHSNAASAGSIAWVLAQVGTDPAVIVLPAGDYPATLPIIIRSNQSLVGAGQGVSRINSTSSTYGIVVGDSTKVTTTSFGKVQGITLTCTGGTGMSCMLMSATQHCQVDDVSITLTSCTSSTAFKMDAARLTEAGTIGNFWDSITNLYVSAGTTGNNYGVWLYGDGTTWISGRNNANTFTNLKIKGSKYGLTVGPAWENRFLGVSIETVQDAGWMVKWDNYSAKNQIYGLYLESGGTTYTGKAILAAPAVALVAPKNITTVPYGNVVYDAFINSVTAGANYANVSIYGSNTLKSGSTLFSGAPDSDLSDDNTTVDNGTATQSWPVQIRVPGEKGPRVKMGLSGIMMQNDDNVSTSDQMHLWPSDESGHMVLAAGGATNRQKNFASGTNPDLTNGHNFMVTNLSDNSTVITSFENPRGAPTVVFSPYPNAHNLTVTFTDSATDNFHLYTDSDSTNDGVTIRRSGTSWIVHFDEPNDRYPMLFVSYWAKNTPSSPDIRHWTLLNRVRGYTDETEQSANGYALQAAAGAFTPDNSTTSYYVGGMFALAAPTAGSYVYVPIPKAGKVTRACVHFYNTTHAAVADTSSVYFRLNGSTDTLISNAVVNTADNYMYCNTSMNVPVAASDYFTIRWIAPTWSGPGKPQNVRITAVVYIEG